MTNGMSRRGILKTGSVLGLGASVAAVTPAPALAQASQRTKKGQYFWLNGDHHVHTLFSNDGKYRVVDHVRQAIRYGVDWLVLTDHGNVAHSQLSTEQIVPLIDEVRKEFGDEILIYHGLEWNIPGAEHATVFVAPGRDDVAVLKEVEARWDARVKGTRDGTAANEALALDGIRFMGEARAKKRVEDIVMIPNHPSRQGIDSPHEIRAWIQAAPDVVIGMEGAPGHQAGGLPAPHVGSRARGLYDGGPGTFSFKGYPVESYRTWGGFDWMTATVGGVWDSLLAEGRLFSVTATSDSHNVYLDTTTRGPGSDFDAKGRTEDPVYSGTVDLTENDFWPGYYSRTHVGAEKVSHASVMQGLREGRVWVDHGCLIDAIDVAVADQTKSATLGGKLETKRGRKVTLTVSVAPASKPNFAGFIPELARVDVILGKVTGPVTDADTMTAPDTRVITQMPVKDLTLRNGTYTWTQEVETPFDNFYVRLRGTDGKKSQPGFLGADIDPAGPAIDEIGNADPWEDLWFYTNPVFVEVGK